MSARVRRATSAGPDLRARRQPHPARVRASVSRRRRRVGLASRLGSRRADARRACWRASLKRPLLAVTWSRLFVEANRSPTQPRGSGRASRRLCRKPERERILDRWWRPHREDVEAARRGRRSRAAVASCTWPCTASRPSSTARCATPTSASSTTAGASARRSFCRRWAAIAAPARSGACACASTIRTAAPPTG